MTGKIRQNQDPAHCTIAVCSDVNVKIRRTLVVLFGLFGNASRLMFSNTVSFSPVFFISGELRMPHPNKVGCCTAIIPVAAFFCKHQHLLAAVHTCIHPNWGTDTSLTYNCVWIRISAVQLIVCINHSSLCEHVALIKDAFRTFFPTASAFKKLFPHSWQFSIALPLTNKELTPRWSIIRSRCSLIVESTILRWVSLLIISCDRLVSSTCLVALITGGFTRESNLIHSC